MPLDTMRNRVLQILYSLMFAIFAISAYRLLGKRALSAKRLVVSSKVLFPAIPTQNCDVVLTFPSSTEDNTLMWLLARLKARAPNLRVQVRHHSHTGIYGFYLTALYESLLQGAEELGLLKPLKSEYGGGMKEFAFEDQDCFAGIEEEASFLTSQERQSIVLHFLNELRATGDDSLKGITFIEGQPIVPLLITKNVISQLFPLHSHEDLKVLRKNWVQAIFSRQPLDLVCQYFGVKISLYFAYLGHYTTWLLLPAVLGLFIFLYQGENEYMDDLFFVGFALFNSVWSTLYLKFWSRTSTSYCYKWGTLQKKDELLKDPRPLFKGDPVKSPVTGQLELSYPPWKRFLFIHFVTAPVVLIGLAFVFVAMLLCFELQEWVNGLIDDEELPYVFSFLPKVLLALVVSVLDEVYKKLAIWLTFKENYRLEESHETGLILKLVLCQFVNSFLSLFYIGFYLRDMDRLRDQLAALLITRQVLGNLKEALMPYVIWKARLYSVGYKLATRMSPASLDKEVERMTQQAEKAGKREEAGKTAEGSCRLSGSEEDDDQDEKIPALTQAEVESEMKKYEGTLEDYLEMVIQFGYVTLFSSAFPLAALCALVNNIIEIRSDAFKLCITHQRPFGQQVENIGIWQQLLVSQTSSSGSFGASPIHQSESPPQRRRRFFDQETCSNQNSSPLGNTVSPSVITPTSSPQRPCDFHTPSQASHNKYRVDESDRPSVPVRKSLLKNNPPSSENNPSVNYAESIVASAMGPIIDSARTEKNVNALATSTDASKVLRDSLPPSGRSLATPGEGDQRQRSEILKRVYRRRLDLDSWRRRSEPVATAVKQAVSMQKNNQGDPIAAQANEDGFRHSRSFSLREEIRRSKDKMHNLEKSRLAGSTDISKPHSDSQTVPNLSPASFSSSLPPPAASTGLKYCGSPMMKNRMGGIPSPQPLRSLSRKSRSFSNIDLAEFKQSFRDRQSWKGELPLLKKNSAPKETNLSKTKLPDSESALIQPDGKDAKNLEENSSIPDPSHPETTSKLATEIKTQESQQIPDVKRASRESMGKPLSLSQTSATKN
ncbi:anoctamin [Elysia marginata]|uniref:Anoctamin n=1 Tax=Elysia marginata TaxID=1093978 RepID=A0AAV4IMH1_9GAST|nr:anoctamin [Elysia marginata]